MSANPVQHPKQRLYGERIIAADETVEGIGRTVTGIVLAPSPPVHWWIAFAGACGLIVVFAVSLVHLWAGNAATPVVSALAIASYDWWVGIAHGSLLVSAVLLLAGVEWRCAVIRIAETVALLGAIVAGFYALLPLGRPGWLDPALPWRGAVGLLPPFGSPAAWDATGLACCIVVCAGLWYVGLLPDLATLRDGAVEAAQARAKGDGAGRPPSLLRARVFSLLAVGWRGSAVQWQRWIEAYRAIALLGALLVIVLQAGASVELAGSAPPGRHDTLLPVTLLVGAVLSGVGITGALIVVIRAVYALGGLITRRHLDVLSRMILVLGLASLYCHVAETLSTLLHGDAVARGIVARGVDGDLAWISWTIVVCGLLPVQVFWLPRARRSGLLIALVGALVAIGTYADHVMLLVVSLQSEAVPLPADANVPGIGDVVTFAGSIGLFLALLLLVLRSLPIVSIAQTRQLAIAHNAPEATAAVAAGPDDTDVPIRQIGAAFATEKSLAAAVSALLGRDRGFRLDACGPVPMPGVFAALRPVEHPIRRTALVSSLAGGFGFLALCLAGALWLSPLGTGARLQASWPFFVLPSVAVALATGTLAILVTLLVRSRLPQRSTAIEGPGFPRSGRNRFRLTAEIRDGMDDAERIARRLAGLPADAGRPSAMRRVPR
ncbi:quinol:electron acceptor oxidoreductase subunit ActD [Methylobacterium thuringiense]|uniref:DUF3341 domain-containing protein n=1 Tax=Methylobacterium thuringiense TaxID=1003091 RepID=A0ABQ4TPX0_9HYPH|nr:quinol:electron acceptor oxidoreductase subunit ActD [Methylobacterium thuringiense]GJE57415.1 hypothetical protein EKPJFOCH_3930 [Methylobacterium thuringiense]